MPEQIQHLVALTERPNSTIRDLDNHLEGQIVTGSTQVTALHAVRDDVSAVALPARQSLELIKEVAKSWT